MASEDSPPTQPFLPEHVPILKAAMLPRVATCTFTPADIAEIAAATNLSKAQILKWASHTRARYTTSEKRNAYLNSVDPRGGTDAMLTPEELAIRVQRYRWGGFNIGEDELKQFKLLKARNAGVFDIRYMAAAIDPIARSVDVFIEFSEQVYLKTLHAYLHELGLGSLHINACASSGNNHEEYAASALAGVWIAARVKESQEGSSASNTPKLYEVGTCTPSLHARASAQLAAYEEDEEEFDEKKDAALKRSIADLHTEVTSHGTTLRSVDTHIAKLTFAEAEIKRLTAALVHSKLLCDRVEYDKGKCTKEIRRLTELMDTLQAVADNATDETTKARKELAHEKALNAILITALADAQQNTAAMRRLHDAVAEHMENDNAAKKRRRDSPSAQHAAAEANDDE